MSHQPSGVDVGFGCIDSLECSVAIVSDSLMEMYSTSKATDAQNAQAYVLAQFDEGCFVTGLGHISTAAAVGGGDGQGAAPTGQDSFAGNVTGVNDAAVRGQWRNNTHAGERFHGSIEWLRCWNDGAPGEGSPHRAQWGGYGQWNGVDGHRFVVGAVDYGDVGQGNAAGFADAYSIHIFSPEGNLVYSGNDCVVGEFSIHPPADGAPFATDDLPSDANALAGQQVLCSHDDI
jgi:hypothetical protein